MCNFILAHSSLSSLLISNSTHSGPLVYYLEQTSWSYDKQFMVRKIICNGVFDTWVSVRPPIIHQYSRRKNRKEKQEKELVI